MKLINIIYDIREKLKLNSDDIDITNEYLAHLIAVKRVFLIKQRFSNTTKNIPEEVKQIICVNLEVANSINGYECGPNILKSINKIPAMMEIGGKSSLIAVRTHDLMHVHFNIIPTERLPFVGYNRYLKNQIYVALDSNGILYFKSDGIQYLNLNSVKLIGVFSDPEEADEFICPEDTDNTTSVENCDFYEKEYPIEGYLVSDLVNLITKELGSTLNIPNDNVNNSNESNRN